MKLTTLIENHEDTAHCLRFEHGLSLLLETEEKKVLFDTGQTGAFLDNALKMDIDLAEITDIVLSHSHYDHSGGLRRVLLEKCPEAEVYAGEGYFRKKYKHTEDGYTYNGAPFSREDLGNAKIHMVTEGVTELQKDLYIVRNFSCTNDFEKRNPRFYWKDQEFYHDDFDDEIALVIRKEKGLVVIAGCSHKGIINMTSEISRKFGAPICGIIGGTHLVNASEERIRRTIEALKTLPLELLAVSHCTGDENIRRLRQEFGKKFIENVTGNVIEL